MYVSAFEVYRIGPGPSSTYTIGPQRAALRFVHDLEADGVLASVAGVEADLYGGLAFHGREHASHHAIVAGLAGQPPERCDRAALNRCLAGAEAEDAVLLGGKHPARFRPSRDLRQVIDHSLAYDGNAVRFVARNVAGEAVASRLYFSTGGGGVLGEGDGGMPHVPYPFSTAESLLESCRSHGKRVHDLVRANECALFSPGEVRAGLVLFMHTMRAAVERGLAADGRLPGGGPRTARTKHAAAGATAKPEELCAIYATAAGEENAVGGKVVSAPSAGAAGPVAALLYHWRTGNPMHQEERAADFLLAGAAVAGLLRIGGVRQVGCQGEIGIAAAMAAAGYAAVHNGSNAQILHAAERALEPHLGLACDLANARIEDPCIERGARAARRAYQAAVAAVHLPAPRVGLDLLAHSLVESGRTMAGRYKAASTGGVAVNIVEC